MKYTRTYLLLIFAILAGIISSCGESPSRSHHIYFVSTMPIEAYVTEFSNDHPGIQVHAYYSFRINDDNWPKHFDAALLPIKPRDTALLMDLSPFVESDIHREDFLPGALEAASADGRITVIPVDMDVLTLLVDTRQLQDAGAPLPSPHWTWDDLLQMAVTVGRHKREQGGGFVFFRHEETRLLFNLLFEHTQPYTRRDGRYVPLLDDRQTRQYIQQLRRVIPDLTSAPHLLSDADPIQLLRERTVAMAIVPYRYLKQHAEQLQETPYLLYTALPQPDYSGDNLRIYTSLAMSRGTAEPRIVWTWLHFLSRRLPPAPDFLPARRAAASIPPSAGTPADTLPIPDDLLRTVQQGESKRHAVPDPEALIIIYNGMLILLQTPVQDQSEFDALVTAVQTQIRQELSDWYARRSASPENIAVIPYTSPEEAKHRTNTLRVHIMPPPPVDFTTFRHALKPFLQEHPQWDVQFWWLRSQADAVSLPYKTWFFTPLSANFLTVEQVEEVRAGMREGDFFPQAVSPFRWQSRLPGLPVLLRPLVLAYDADTLQRLGAPQPDGHWTVADVWNTAKQLSPRTPFPPAYVAHSGWEFAFLLDQLGIPVFTPELRPRFTAPDVLHALETLRGMTHGGPLIQPAGRSLFTFTFSDVIPLPSPRFTPLAPRKNSRWPLEVHFTTVNRQSPHPRIAWEWAAFTVEHPELVARGLPALRRLAQSESTRARLGEGYYAAAMTMLRRVPPTPLTDADVLEGLALWWFDRALRTAGPEADLAQALAPAQAKAEAFLTCTGGRAEDWEHVLTCLRQVDPTHPMVRTGP